MRGLSLPISSCDNSKWVGVEPVRNGCLEGKAGGRLYGGALIAMALGVAGGKDEPLVAIEFAEQGMRREIVTQLLGVGRSGGEFDGALAGGVEFGQKVREPTRSWAQGFG